MIHHCAANTECVPKMHGRHCSQRVDVFSLHPNALSVVMANTINKAVFRGKQSRWHTRVYNEDDESKEIGKSHCSSDDGEGVV